MKKYVIIAIVSLLALAVGEYFMPKRNLQHAEAASVGQSLGLDTLNGDEQNNHNENEKIEHSSNNEPVKQNSVFKIPSSSSAVSGWKTYSNTKYGFSFQYPGNWVKDGEDANVSNLKGVTTELDVQFKDTVSQTTFIVAYHLPPAGAQLYQYALGQYKSLKGPYATGSREIEVSGNKAIVSSIVSTVNGRGQAMVVPLKTITVIFEDKQHSGEFEIHLQTPAKGAEKQDAILNQLLTGFIFISK